MIAYLRWCRGLILINWSDIISLPATHSGVGVVRCVGSWCMGSSGGKTAFPPLITVTDCQEGSTSQLMYTGPLRAKTWPGTNEGSLEYIKNTYSLYIGLYHLFWSCTAICFKDMSFTNMVFEQNLC